MTHASSSQGEFFLEFYHQANAFCRLPITPSTVGDAQAAYLRAASLLGCDESGGFNQFQLVARPHTFGGPGEDTDTGEAWAEFGFQPNVPWPLQVRDHPQPASQPAVSALELERGRQEEAEEDWGRGELGGREGGRDGGGVSFCHSLA